MDSTESKESLAPPIVPRFDRQNGPQRVVATLESAAGYSTDEFLDSTNLNVVIRWVALKNGWTATAAQILSRTPALHQVAERHLRPIVLVHGAPSGKGRDPLRECTFGSNLCSVSPTRNQVTLLAPTTECYDETTDFRVCDRLWVRRKVLVVKTNHKDIPSR